MLTEQDSILISSVRFPLAVMVVAIHAFIPISGWDYYSVSMQGAGSNIAAFSMIALSHVFCHIAVPTFFLISGFLFFANFANGGRIIWRKKIIGRTKSLLIPYILWICIYVLYLVVLDYRDVFELGLLDWIKGRGGLSVFWCSNKWNLSRIDLWGNPAVSSSPILVPFWFMRNLLVCICFTPLYWYIFQKDSGKVLRIIGIITLSILYLSQTSLIIPGFSSSSFFYFGIGSLLGLNERSLCLEASKFKMLGYVSFGVLFLAEICLDGHNTYIGNLIYPFFVVSGVVSIINIVSYKKRVWGGQKYTFFIFAFHIFILPVVGILLEKVISWITGFQTVNDIEFANRFPYLLMLEYVAIILTTIALTMGIYIVIDKILPRTCKLLCGR